MKAWERRVRCGLVLFVAGAVFFCAGCEPLRKKFTRKKKDAQAIEVLPVLEPIDYPDKVETPQMLLKHHYGLWQVWFGEVERDMSEGSTDKRMAYNLNQLSIQLEELQKIFSGEQKKQLEAYALRLARIQAEFTKPQALWNVSTLETDLRLLDKDFRKHFRPQVAEEFLAP